MNFHPFRNGPPSRVLSPRERDTRIINPQHLDSPATVFGDRSFRVNFVYWEIFGKTFSFIFSKPSYIISDRRCWQTLLELDRRRKLDGALRKVGRNYPITLYPREFLCENNIWLIESWRARDDIRVIIVIENKNARDLVNIVCKSDADFHFPFTGRRKGLRLNVSFRIGIVAVHRGSSVLQSISIYVSLSRKPFNGRHYRYCIAFEPRSGTPIPPSLLSSATGLQFRRDDPQVIDAARGACTGRRVLLYVLMTAGKKGAEFS